MEKYSLYGDGFKDQDHSFRVDKEEWDTFKNIKPLMSNRSGYYNNMIFWKINSDDLGKFTIYLHMVINNIDKVFPDNLYFHQYDLCKHSYFEVDYDGEGVHLGFKRPFGNSNVHGDVLESLIKEYNIFKDKSYLHINFPELSKFIESTDSDYYIHDIFDYDMFQKTLMDLYEVFKAGIQKWEWFTYNYEVYYERTWKTIDKSFLFGENKFNDSQQNNTLKCVSTYFVPSMYEIREKNLNLLDQD